MGMSLSLSSLSLSQAVPLMALLPELFSKHLLFCLCALQYSFIHVVLFFSFYFTPVSFTPSACLSIRLPRPFLTPSFHLSVHPRSSCMQLSSPPCRCPPGASSTAEACPRRPTWEHTPRRPTHTHRATKAAAPLSRTRPR